MSATSKKIALAALAGVLVTGFSAPVFAAELTTSPAGKTDASPTGKTDATGAAKAAPAAGKEKHACKGMNSCKGNSPDGKNACKGKSDCATDGSKK